MYKHKIPSNLYLVLKNIPLYSISSICNTLGTGSDKVAIEWLFSDPRALAHGALEPFSMTSHTFQDEANTNMWLKLDVRIFVEYSKKSRQGNEPNC